MKYSLNMPSFHHLMQSMTLSKPWKMDRELRSNSAVNHLFRHNALLTKLLTKRSSQRKPALPSGCSGCGSKEHGPGTNKPRSAHCPAKDFTCDHCSIEGNFSSVCRKRKRASAGSIATESSIRITDDIPSSSLANSSWLLTSHEDMQANIGFVSQLKASNRRAWRSSGRLPRQSSTVHTKVILPHMEWTDGQFVQCRPHPLPMLKIKVDIIKEAHEDFKRPISHSKRVYI